MTHGQGLRSSENFSACNPRREAGLQNCVITRRKKYNWKSPYFWQHISQETPAPVTINCVVRTSLLTPYPEMWIFHHTEFQVASWKKGRRRSIEGFFHNVLKLCNSTNWRRLITINLLHCCNTSIKNPKAEALAAYPSIGADLFLTKYRTNEHTANAYCVNYSAVPYSNPDGSSKELWQIRMETVVYIV